MDGSAFTGLGTALRVLIVFAVIGLAALVIGGGYGLYWLATHASISFQ